MHKCYFSMLCTTESQYSAMAIIAIADIETRVAVELAAEDLKATFVDVLSGINLKDECNVCMCVCNYLYV